MIGRKKEVARLQRAYDSGESELVAVYGRRRVGKTFLINELFAGKYAFHAAGIERGKKKEQLDAFRVALRRYGAKNCPKLNSWIEAFGELGGLLETRPEARKVVFLDELPWFDSACSGFLKAFEWFWNTWASERKDILLVICGSATTWIIDKVLNSRGGLHNRVTVQIPLEPFTLLECEQYAAYKRLGFDRRQIIECYMALGGVAYYWSILQEGLSAAQNFDRIFFSIGGELRNEFDRVFASLYRLSELHVRIVRELGKVKIGRTRDEILKALGEPSGGDVSKALKELVQCGFVRYYSVIGKAKRGGFYQLIDPYCVFYLDFVEKWRGDDLSHWSRIYDSPEVNAWRGYAFERVCMWHIPQIKSALGISGIEANVYSWRWVPNDLSEDGVQIDMLIDRKDAMVNVCEIKYSENEYEIDKEEDRKIRHRCETFRIKSGVRKSVQPVMIAANGVKQCKYRGNILHYLDGNDLFA